ncbi:MAG TPA: proton-conducting transporter membrane subunit, partial [Stellaceae bacterium]|nr:proton-conducting transporter membrane subunit [Stellaceae bacterium]
MRPDFSIFVMLGGAVFGAVVCLGLPRPQHVLRLIVAVSALELGLAANIWASVLANGFVTAADQWFYIDAFSAFYLVVLVLVFLLSSVFAGLYFANEPGEHPFTLAVAHRFGALWLGSLTAMMLVLVSNNLGIMWVGMEATTLLSAFLISLHPSRLSLEAMWKYLIICSVGIAFAFIGTIFAAASIQSAGGAEGDALFWTTLASADVKLDPTLMRFAFIFILVGYGTKTGLAPIHSWLPDAHSQAPTPVSAMFSGFLLNTALYCIMRFVSPARHALGAEFANGLLIFFGTTSILVAAGFIVFQRDAKRLLAYHSVEHLGIITLGFGLGPLGTFAALFHTLNHSVCKSLAFFAVGRLGQQAGSHDMHRLSGALRADRLWGIALLGSVLALIGVAPFSVFMSEYQLLRAAAAGGKWLILVLFLAASGVVFLSALRHLIDMAYGEPQSPVPVARGGIAGMFPGILIVASAMGLLVFLGLWMPVWFSGALGSAAAA